MPAEVRPSLLERLQGQVVALEREASYLRQVDKTMQQRVQRAVAESETLKASRDALAKTVLDLRRQLEVRAAELTLMRGELETLRASRPSPAPPAPAPESRPATRFDLLEVDE